MLRKSRRYHVVQEFNKGVYDYIIATDEGGSEQDDEDSGAESLQLEEDCMSSNPLVLTLFFPLILGSNLSSAWFRFR